MAEFKQLIITYKGQALIAKMLSGSGNVQFTKIAVSDTTYNDGQLPGLTALSSIKQTTLISKVVRTNNVTVQVEGAMMNTNLSTGYYMRTIGLYAIDPDEGEILYAVTKASVEGYMPPYNGITVSGAYFKLVTAVSNASNVTLEVDPAAVATIGNIQDLQEQILGVKEFLGILEPKVLIAAQNSSSEDKAKAHIVCAENAYQGILDAMVLVGDGGTIGVLKGQYSITSPEGSFDIVGEEIAFVGYGWNNDTSAGSYIRIEEGSLFIDSSKVTFNNLLLEGLNGRTIDVRGGSEVNIINCYIRGDIDAYNGASLVLDNTHVPDTVMIDECPVIIRNGCDIGLLNLLNTDAVLRDSKVGNLQQDGFGYIDIQHCDIIIAFFSNEINSVQFYFNMCTDLSVKVGTSIPLSIQGLVDLNRMGEPAITIRP